MHVDSLSRLILYIYRYLLLNISDESDKLYLRLKYGLLWIISPKGTCNVRNINFWKMSPFLTFIVLACAIPLLFCF